MKPKSRSHGFQDDPEKSDVANLNRFLELYGLEKELNDLVDENGRLPLQGVIDRLPKEDSGGINPAHRELQEYYDAIPMVVHANGLRLEPEAILTRLKKKTEFHHDLGEGIVRLCSGVECAHFDACPFKEAMKDYRPRDGVECAVDRKVINDAVNAFLHPENGKPKISPGRPAQELLFEQLVHQLVRMRRITMTMKTEDIMIRELEALRDRDGSEDLVSANVAEHPLMRTADNCQKRIEKLMKAMGITPEFEIRYDLWETVDERQSADERSKELFLERLQDAVQTLESAKQPEQLEENISRKDAMREVLEYMREREGEHTR